MVSQPGGWEPVRAKLIAFLSAIRDRVFYVPDEGQFKVVVYYAGKHPNPAPTP
jgi:hypothetical protein